MARKVDFPDFDDVRKLYREGASISQLARRLGIAYGTFYGWARRNGLCLRPQSETVRLARADSHAGIAAGAIRLYRDGLSEKAVAERFSVDRNVIRRLSLRANVKPRGRSESMCLRMSQTSADERRRLASAAHSAVRGRARSESELAVRALRRERTQEKIGDGERLFANWLAARGSTTSLQKAVGRYNIDVALPPVAVEIHVTSQNPLKRVQTRERIKYLADRGWHVLYVWVSKRHFLSEAAADDAVAFRKRAQCDPSPIGQYRVIRGSGELVAEGRSDLD